MTHAKSIDLTGSPWGWAAGGALIGLTVAVLVFAPARWLTQALQQLSHGRLVLSESRGTIWNGSARLLLTGGAGSRDVTALPDRVAWQMHPSWRGWTMAFTAPCCTPRPLQLQVTPRWGGMQLTLADGQSQWPASVLAGLGAPWNTIQAQGLLNLSTQGLSVVLGQGRLAIEGQARLEAIGMSSRLSTLKPIGSYRLVLEGGTNASLLLTTLEGNLQLSGNGRWLDSRLQFDGVASARPEHVDALSNLLNIIGQRNDARSIIKIS